MTHTPTDFLKVANQAAEHFGFQTAEQIKKSPECRSCEKKAPHTVTGTNKRVDAQHGLLSTGIATYCDEKFHAIEGPVLMYTTHQVPRTGESAVSFHVFNVDRSIAEAILIQVARGVASELGYEDHTVRINSLGCNESITRYSRELGNYLRKRIDTMPSAARELMKEHPMLALQSLLDDKHELGHSSPNPLEYLSDGSRKHFREIIEYLDMSETPYEIDSKMIGHHECYSDALFSLDINTEEDVAPPITARGGRFDEFVSRNTGKRTPAAGLVITLNNSKAPARNPRTKAQKPSVYVVQLGFGPKVRSLLLVDSLRRAGIPVLHDLTSDSLSTQLRDAEAKGVNYTIIVGQKEFVEGTVILRDMNLRNQEYVPQDMLIKKLKRRNGVVTI